MSDNKLFSSSLARGVTGLVIFLAVAGGTAVFLAGSDGEAEPDHKLDRMAQKSAAPATPVSPFGRFLAGRFAESQSDLDQAARLMTGILEEQPDNKDFLRQAFVLSVSAGHKNESIKLAGKLDTAGSKSSTALMLLAAQDFEKKDFAAGLKRLEEANLGGLGRYSLPIAKAWANAGLKKFDDAMAALAALKAEQGFKVMYQLHAGLISAEAGKYQEAADYFRDVVEKKKLELAPIRIQRAALPVLQKLGLKDEALALIDRQLKNNSESFLFEKLRESIRKDRPIPPLASTPVEGMAEGLFNIATALPRDRAGNVVMMYAQLALMLRSDFPLADILIGDIMIARERFGDAVDAYKRIKEDSPYYWTARLRMADALYEGERLDESRSLLEKMSSDQPKRFDALLKLGNHLRYKEKYKEAVAVYDQAFDRIGDVSKRDWSLFYSRGIALERAKLWDRAETDFLKALELSPDQPYVLNYLGYSWVERKKNLDQAKKMIENAVAQRRNDGYIVDSMGWVLYRLGDYKNAVKHLERAVQLRPHDPIINDHLGDAYWRVGRRHEARFQWRRALSFKPEEEDKAKIETKLDKGLGKPEIVEQKG